jgi:hypothetical protein
MSSLDTNSIDNSTTSNNNSSSSSNKIVMLTHPETGMLKRLESGQSANTTDSVWDDEMGRAGCDQLFFVTSYR